MKISGESTQYNAVSPQTVQMPEEKQAEAPSFRLMTEAPPITLGNAIEFSEGLLALLQSGAESAGLRAADPIEIGVIEGSLLPTLFNDPNLNAPPVEASNEVYEVDFFGFGYFGTRMSDDNVRGIPAVFADADASGVTPLKFVLDRYATLRGEIDNLDVTQEEKDKYYGQLKKQFGIACAFMGLYEDEKNGHDQSTGASGEAVFKWNFGLYVTAEYDKTQDMQGSMQTVFLSMYKVYRREMGGSVEDFAEMLGVTDLLGEGFLDAAKAALEAGEATGQSQETQQSQRRRRAEPALEEDAAETVATAEEAQQMWMQAIQEFLEKLNARLILDDGWAVPGANPNPYQQQIQEDM